MKSKFIQLQITFPKMTEAEEIGKFLVANRWAACAQIVGEIESQYIWKGTLKTAMEYLLFAKTRAELFDVVVEEISRLHSYECPQIVAVPLEFISKKYEDWLDAQTRRE